MVSPRTRFQQHYQAPEGYAVKDISTSREGEAPADPHAFLGPRQMLAVWQEPHPPIALNAMTLAITCYLPSENPSRRRPEERPSNVTPSVGRPSGAWFSPCDTTWGLRPRFFSDAPPGFHSPAISVLDNFNTCASDLSSNYGIRIPATLVYWAVAGSSVPASVHRPVPGVAADGWSGLLCLVPSAVCNCCIR